MSRRQGPPLSSLPAPFPLQLYEKMKRIEVEFIGSTNLTMTGVEQYVSGIANTVMEDLKDFVHLAIPRASGNLREAIMKSISVKMTRGTRTQGPRLAIFFGTTKIDYLHYVDRFMNANVQHQGETRLVYPRRSTGVFARLRAAFFARLGARRGGSPLQTGEHQTKGTRIMLNDPDAQGFFFGKMINLCQQSLEFNFQRVFKRYTQMQMRYLTVTFIGHVQRFRDENHVVRIAAPVVRAGVMPIARPRRARR